MFPLSQLRTTTRIGCSGAIHIRYLKSRKGHARKTYRSLQSMAQCPPRQDCHNSKDREHVTRCESDVRLNLKYLLLNSILFFCQGG